jgi:hypothetical protein
MRCLACNRNLSDKESTRKFVHSKTYVDLCNKCFDTIKDERGMEIEENEVLSDTIDYDKIVDKWLEEKK